MGSIGAAFGTILATTDLTVKEFMILAFIFIGIILLSKK